MSLGNGFYAHTPVHNSALVEVAPEACCQPLSLGFVVSWASTRRRSSSEGRCGVQHGSAFTMLGLLLLSAACIAGADPNMSTLIRLAQHPMAVCLDGKPAGYYLRRGTTPEGRRRTYIHHEGGGWCQLQTPLEVWPNDNCEARASTYLGSLEGDNATQAWNASIGCAGCSPDPAVNPLMASWNAVYIRYCDGGTMSGRVVDPVCQAGERRAPLGLRVRGTRAALCAHAGFHFAERVR